MQSAEQTRNQLTKRQAELDRRLEVATLELGKLNLEMLGAQASQTEIEKDTQEEEAVKLAASLKNCENELAEKTSLRDSCALKRNEADASLARITAEIDALSYLLLENAQANGTPAGDSLKVAEGMELALSVILGADLALPFDKGEQGYWRRDLEAGERPTTPLFGTPITNFVSGAQALSAR